jgi:hypothetical protein
MENTRSNSLLTTVLNYLLQLIGVGLFYWLMIYTTIYYWLYTYLHKTAKVTYEGGPNFTKELYLLLLLFSLFCYVANRFFLDLYHRKTVKQLIISIVVDYLIWPIALSIVIFYDNKFHTTIIYNVSKLFNIYIITALLVIKNIIAARLLSKTPRE